MSKIGQNIVNKSPEFDPRNYGFRKLRDLLEDTKQFEFKDSDALTVIQAAYVRCKRKRRSYS